MVKTVKDDPREVAKTANTLIDLAIQLDKAAKAKEQADHRQDEITIEPGPAPGLFMACSTRGDKKAKVLLPVGFQTWTRDELAAHFRRFVTPKLKADLDRGLAGDAHEPVPEADVVRIEKAREKRAMRAAKLAERQRAPAAAAAEAAQPEAQGDSDAD